MLAEVARREGWISTGRGDEAASRRGETSSAIARIRWRCAPATTAISRGGSAGRSRRSSRLREDAPLVDAVETIEWFSSMISSKLYRAICGQAEGWEGREEAQTDFNGSAKIALIAIAESRAAWSC